MVYHRRLLQYCFSCFGFCNFWNEWLILGVMFFFCINAKFSNTPIASFIFYISNMFNCFGFTFFWSSTSTRWCRIKPVLHKAANFRQTIFYKTHTRIMSGRCWSFFWFFNFRFSLFNFCFIRFGFLSCCIYNFIKCLTNFVVCRFDCFIIKNNNVS